MGALAAACLELLRAQAHLTVNASFEFEPFGVLTGWIVLDEHVFWMGNAFDTVHVHVQIVQNYSDVWWHNCVIWGGTRS